MHLLKVLSILSASSSNWVLFGSWFCFMTAIILNLISYSPAKKALQFQRKRIEKYYLLGDTDALGEKKKLSSLCVDRLRFFSVLLYIVALILTSVFIILNQNNFINLDQVNGG